MRKNLALPVAILLGLLVLFALVPAAGAKPPTRPAAGTVTIDPKLPVHPLLQYGAQVDPDKVVRLLVQKKSRNVKSQAIATAAGTDVVEDFPFANTLVLTVKQKVALALAKNPNIRYITLDAPVKGASVDASNLATTFEQTLSIPELWNGTPPATGQGVTVAVLDSGVNENHPDLAGKVVSVAVGRNTTGDDTNGHGTHVVGTINGMDAQGRYIGVAPDARVISIKIADDQGLSYESDLMRGLQWVYNNRTQYNIRVINLSVSGAVPTSYASSAVDAAVEQLWMAGVVVVTAAGNKGSAEDAVWYAPGNDPFAITVGALDDNSTADTSDDSLAPFSSYGITPDGFPKPDVVAPGRRIVAPLAGPGVTLATMLPDHVVDSNYIRLSGTSMSAPVVTGVVALLLERYPNLTPNQVKWLLTGTANPYSGMPDSAGVVNPVAALASAAGPVGEANQGLTPANLIDPSTGEIVSSDSFWDQSFWDQSFWDQSFWDQTYFEVYPGE